MTTFRFDEDANDFGVNSHLNQYELDLKTFMPIGFVDFDAKINRIKVEELEELDILYVDQVSQGFIELKQHENFIYVNSTDLFDQIDLTIEIFVKFRRKFDFISCLF